MEQPYTNMVSIHLIDLPLFCLKTIYVLLIYYKLWISTYGELSKYVLDCSSIQSLHCDHQTQIDSVLIVWADLCKLFLLGKIMFWLYKS